MAKLTGQFTTPALDANNNKINKPFLRGVVFVFQGATKVTRESDDKGKYSFDLANGEYDVSMYLKGNTEKDRFDVRPGEKFVVTSTTTADALDKWLQVIGAGGKDELAAYYENLLAQMQAVYDKFQDETKTDGEGLFVKQSSVAKNYLSEGGNYLFKGSADNLTAGDVGLYNGSPASIAQTTELPNSSLNWVETSYIFNNGARKKQTAITYTEPRLSLRVTTNNNNVWTRWAEFYSTYNTTVDSNGNIKAASPIIKLFSDHIEHNDSFTEKPIFEKLDTGVYKISNTLGLAKEGWYIETPKDKNGLPYFLVDWEQDEENNVIIKVFTKKLDLETLDFVNGESIDIGEDQRWIDLRFHEEREAETEIEE